MMTMDELKERVHDIPPLQKIAVRVLQMSRDPSTAPRDFVEVIKYDAGITAKVLSVCNSAFYGLPRHVTSLQEAMVYLGIGSLVNFVLAGCLADYCRDPNEGYGLDSGELWRHSVGCAIAAQKIAERCLGDKSSTAFTAGLLHDFGKMVLNTFVAEDFQAILCLVEKYGMTFLDAEQKVVGWTHAECGAQIAEAWSLPPELICAIRHHHNPLASEDHRKLVAAVHIGDILCLSFGIGVGVDGLAYQLQPGVVEMLNIRPKDLYDLSVEFFDAFRRTREVLSA